MKRRTDWPIATGLLFCMMIIIFRRLIRFAKSLIRLFDSCKRCRMIGGWLTGMR